MDCQQGDHAGKECEDSRGSAQDQQQNDWNQYYSGEDSLKQFQL